VPVRRAGAPAPDLSTWSATMTTHTHPIDARANVSLIAAFILIVGFGVLALATDVRPRSESMQVPSTEGTSTEAVVEWGD
jgi:hypothetical protein